MMKECIYNYIVCIDDVVLPTDVYKAGKSLKFFVEIKKSLKD